MNRENNNIDELLVKYLLDEADAQENLALNKWRNAKPENEKYFTDFRLIWQQSKSLESIATIDENAAWERMQDRLKQETSKQPIAKKINLNFRYLMRVAAVLIFCAGTYIIYQKQAHQIITVQSENEIKTANLPDGSVVTLNKNASISYPRTFTGTTRSVTLSGEAFFNISPNKAQPFIIDANSVKVTVVGTSFNVKSDAAKTEVVVETGIVEVSKRKYSVRLNPNEKATVGRESAPVKDVATDALYNYYRSGKFECKNTPLSKLVDALSESYGQPIEIANPQLEYAPINVTLFRNVSLEENLNTLRETLDFTIEHRGAKIILQ